MGIAYLIYMGIAVLIYKIIRKFIKNKIILKLVIAFSILIPTYDIIIGNALKFYYCKFTDMEKINKQRERPEVVFYQKEEPFSKYEYAVSEARTYLSYIKAIQIETKDGILHEFRAKNYIKPIKLENVFEVDKNTIKKSNFIIRRTTCNMPKLFESFLWCSKVEIINEDSNVIAWSRVVNTQKYNFDIFYELRGKVCGSELGEFGLLEKTIKGEEDAK